jgi:hypothetical protein
VEAYLPTGMTRHSCRPCGSTPAHRDVPSRLQAVWKHIYSQGCPFMVASCGKHTCFPFCVKGCALVAVKVAWTPFRIFPPLLREDPTPRGRARRSRLLGGRKRRDPRQKGRARQNALQGDRTSRDLFYWAGLGHSCAHDYFRRAKADVF